MKIDIESELSDVKQYKITRVSDKVYERFRGTLDLDSKPCCDEPSCGGSTPRPKNLGVYFKRDGGFEIREPARADERTLIAAFDSLLETEPELYMTTQYPSRCVPMYMEQGRTDYVADQFKRMGEMKEAGIEARARFFAGRPRLHVSHPDWSANEEIALMEIQGTYLEIRRLAYLLDKGMGVQGIWLGGYDTDVYDGVGLTRLK